jgi:two-component system OmpR family response regulator
MCPFSRLTENFNREKMETTYMDARTSQQLAVAVDPGAAGHFRPDRQSGRVPITNEAPNSIFVRSPSANRLMENASASARELARILIVSTDFEMRHMILNYLTVQGLHAVPVQTRQEMARQFAIDDPSLVVLDLGLGEDDGLDLLRHIRSRSDVPIIVTAAHRREEMDVVLGLELGADDYVAKPFGLRELVARIRAILRRRARKPSSEPKTERGRFRFGSLELDRRTRRVVDPDGRLVMLTKGEYALLTAFIDAPQRPLSREHLLQASRVDADVFDRSIDVQILRLRRKLEVDPSAPQIIRTERGVGYILTLAVEAL